LLAEETALVAVVKANAYGHGLEAVLSVAASQVDWLAVHSAAEARAIRRHGVSLPILVMGFVPPDELFDLDQDIHVLVSCPEVLGWLGEYRARSGVALPVHLKVETGTHRQGVAIGEIGTMCQVAARHGLSVVGVATHFANIEDTLEHSFAQQQLRSFLQAVETLSGELGGRPPYIHAACSAAALLFRETNFTMARIGISMYGHWPSRETQLSWTLDHGRDGVQLKPVLSWKALVGQIQEVAAGETVGYGRTWTALRPTRLAVVPVGYSDGYPRRLGNQARALVGGAAVPVVGRVCMNILMLDVTDVAGVAVGDEVVLIGRAGELTVSAEELASLADSINYEILARLSPAIPRFLLD
jgi:alanine racemase